MLERVGAHVTLKYLQQSWRIRLARKVYNATWKPQRNSTIERPTSKLYIKPISKDISLSFCWAAIYLLSIRGNNLKMVLQTTVIFHGQLCSFTKISSYRGRLHCNKSLISGRCLCSTFDSFPPRPLIRAPHGPTRDSNTSQTASQHLDEKLKDNTRTRKGRQANHACWLTNPKPNLYTARDDFLTHTITAGLGRL